MIAWTAQIAACVALMGSTGPSYEQALKTATDQGKPLLVYVGAPWCPGCQTMKQQHLPVLKQRGDFKSVVFTMINSDERPELTRQLLKVNAIPQLILFVHNRAGWQRAELVGAHEPAEVRRFLQRETTAHLAKSPQERQAAESGQEITTLK